MDTIHIEVPDPPLPARTRRIDELPGPRPWPLVGNLLQLDRQRIHLRLEEWERRYGPVYRLRLGRTSLAVISDPNTITQVLRARPGTWRRWHKTEEVFKEVGIDGLLTAEGDNWRRQRRLVMSALDPEHLRQFFPSLAVVTERLRRRWSQAARDGGSFDLPDDLMRYTVDVTAGLAFGVDINTVEQGYSELHAHLDKALPRIFRRRAALFASWRYLRLPADRRLDRDVQAIHRVVRELIAAARMRLAADPARARKPPNLIEAMLVARDADGREMPEHEVVGNVFTTLLAGEDTTAHSLAWTLQLLYRHPEAWRAVVKEADAALGEAALPPSLEQATTLPYIEGCIHEAMRLHPVAPISRAEANEDTVVGDVAIPKGTSVWCLMRKGAIDEERVEQAGEFRPERWLSDPGAAAAPTAKRLSMPFGSGPRLCPGRYLAVLEMRMVIAMLARNFELVEVALPDGRPLTEHTAIGMAAVGLRMRLAPRRRRHAQAGEA
ncbi:cytochrome P450 [Aquabacterium sp. A7-Y]|uniref:cytochrome P450 n=1 Tax=Aquabacterium sp. A7-Y TaxID=1349605 RepID=UPI00223DA67A|nr:cytochrome P450 [Aquabacterium sp. A7-Y]MCW7539678.1 cytochrome P450 [Aquabacterium sp. A7-Y]